MDVHNQNQILNQKISKLQTEFILIDHGLCPDWSRLPHKRRRDTVYFILDGQGKITINGKEFYPKKNNLVLLPKNSIVSLYSENETCYNKYWCEFLMHFDGVSLFDVVDFPYMIEAANPTKVIELLDLLDELHLKQDTFSALRIKSALIELISMFLENTSTVSALSDKGSAFIDKMKSFINSHITGDLSVKVLAREMGFNEKYFIDLFKKHFGTTPAQYVKSTRLEKAKNELLYTDEKVLNIVNHTGYSTLQKLSADFKAYTGFTPSEFRKKFK